MVLGKGNVKYDVLDIFLMFIIITCPSGSFPKFGHIIDATIISMDGALIIIIESERLVGC